VIGFREFTLEDVENKLGIRTQEADLFPGAGSAPLREWLHGSLARGTRLALVSEKSRSEFIVAPILLAAREITGDRIDAERGLTGECDFILAVGPSVPPLRAPIATLVEAKKNDIEAGLGQCVAQMVAARQFNERAGRTGTSVFGCVTTGEDWQFLRLTDSVALLDSKRYYFDNVGGILGVLQAIIKDAVGSAEQGH
jgi:hypothetical protein